MSSRFWYAHHDDGLPQLVTVDLGETISDLPEEPTIEELGSVAESLTGRRTHVAYRRRARLTLRHEFNSATTWAKLHTMCSHLQRGYPVGFAVEHTTAVAGHTLDVIQHATTTFEYLNHWLITAYGLEITAAMTSSSVVKIRTFSPEYRELTATVTSSHGPTVLGAAEVVLASAAQQRFEEGAFIREEGFFPLLYLDPAAVGRTLIRSENARRSWVLELPLVEALDVEDQDPPPVLADLVALYEAS